MQEIPMLQMCSAQKSVFIFYLEIATSFLIKKTVFIYSNQPTLAYLTYN
jgi:hypothetical protein